jgi:ABC-type glycerol-3-phosphate transport system substrate-binding protein
MLMNRWTHGSLALVLVLLLGMTALAAQEAPTPVGPASTAPTLRIWFPDTLGASEDGEVTALLARLVDEFQQANPDVQVDFRLKLVGDISTPGTLYHNLRTTRATAPGALPHLTLLRRPELDYAVREGLITPVRGAIETALLDDMPPAVVALGEVQATLFAIPFLLAFDHQALQPDLDTPAQWAFDAVLASAWRFAFPGGDATRLSELLAAQLAEAGAVDEAGQLAPDLETLTAIYGFYEAGRANDLFPPESLRADVPGDYLPLLMAGEVPAGVVTSSDYLRLLSEGAALQAAPLPTLEGGLASTLDGWLWVLPTGTPEERALALRFVYWMSEPARQADYARTVFQIPAAGEAVAEWAEGAYGALVASLLREGVLPPVDLAARQPELARALQNGLLQVLNGTATAAEAAETALDAAG